MKRHYRSLFLFSLFLVSFSISNAVAEQPDVLKRFDVALLWGMAKTPANTLPTIKGIPVFGTLTEESTTISIPKNLAWQADIAWRVTDIGPVSFSLELPVTSASTRQATINAAFSKAGIIGYGNTVPAGSAYFFTPGLRAGFFRHRRFSPYAAIGYGVESERLVSSQLGLNLASTAVSSSSTSTSSPFAYGGYPVSQRAYKGVFDVGGGVDIRMNKHISFRAEMRDFRRSGTGSTGYTVDDFLGLGLGPGFIENIVEPRHTLVALGGLDFHF